MNFKGLYSLRYASDVGHVGGGGGERGRKRFRTVPFFIRWVCTITEPQRSLQKGVREDVFNCGKVRSGSARSG